MSLFFRSATLHSAGEYSMFSLIAFHYNSQMVANQREAELLTVEPEASTITHNTGHQQRVSVNQTPKRYQS